MSYINASQLENETKRMFNSILSSEWTEKVDEPYELDDPDELDNLNDTDDEKNNEKYENNSIILDNRISSLDPSSKIRHRDNNVRNRLLIIVDN